MKTGALLGLLLAGLSVVVPAREIHFVSGSSGSVPKADAAWQLRDQPGKMQEAITLWKAALDKDPGQVELYIPLTKAVSREYRHTTDPKTKLHLVESAKGYGAQAAEKNPNSPQAHAAYAEALGQWAQANKGVGSLKFVKQAVAELNKAIALDPHYAFAHMMLAQFYEKSPSVISVGDKAKALKHAKLAVEYGENYAINRVTLAKIYMSRGDKVAAKEQLEQAMALKAPEDAIPETKSDQEDARELLKGL